MKIKKSYLGMIKAFPGGWDAIAAALGMSRNGLENRVYERKGQGVTVDTALQLQAFSGTTLFAEAVAASSGGAFVKLPEDMSDGNEVLAKKFRDIYVRLGIFASHFEEATADELIDPRERACLDADIDGLQRGLSELMALTIRVYCKPDGGQDGAV
ncbi:YmfL family putative regulatory protein [Janthinobacterium sp. OK676]|uniref:YmfL family putative regulatory protein n=1 Tax=Janthinobacterium sp. OK676 TaxID=1855295 RepID=UPI000B8814C1|nr:YmfL family putative regulatory protein [Janthinobacterium sp. OK676]